MTLTKKQILWSGIAGVSLAIVIGMSWSFALQFFEEERSQEQQEQQEHIIQGMSTFMVQFYQTEMERWIQVVLDHHVKVIHFKSLEGLNFNREQALNALPINSEIFDLTVWKSSQKSSHQKNPSTRFLQKETRRIQLNLLETVYPQSIEKADLSEQSNILKAFEGQTVAFLSSFQVSQSPVLGLAIPLGRWNVQTQTVLVAHLPFQEFKRKESGQQWEGFLVDHQGAVFSKTLGDSQDLAKHSRFLKETFQKFQKKSAMHSQMMEVQDPDGLKRKAWLFPLKLGNLFFLSLTLPQIQEDASFWSVRHLWGWWGGAGFGVLTSLFILTGLYLKHRFQKKISILPAKDLLTFCYGHLKYDAACLDTRSPQEVLSQVKIFWDQVKSSLQGVGGQWIRLSESSFVGVWGVQKRAFQPWEAAMYAVDLRRALLNLKHQQEDLFWDPQDFQMSVHTGPGWMGFLESQKDQILVFGEGFQEVQKLYQLGVRLKAGCLVSQEIWESSQGQLLGEPRGVVQWRADSVKRGVFQVNGYLKDHSEEIRFETPDTLAQRASSEGGSFGLDTSPFSFQEVSGERRWWIHNGFQMLGPWTEHEIAIHLFTQEIDFDCDCILEGEKETKKIQEAGIFSGSGEKEARFWVYDGSTLQGPLSEEFMKKAQEHQLFQENFDVCETSTVKGWKKIHSWEGFGSPGNKS